MRSSASPQANSSLANSIRSNSQGDLSRTTSATLQKSTTSSSNSYNKGKSQKLKDMKQFNRKQTNPSSNPVAPSSSTNITRPRFPTADSAHQLDYSGDPSFSHSHSSHKKVSRLGALFGRGHNSRDSTMEKTLTSSNTDLSYTDSRPDMVKIFCEHIRKGLESKGVKVTRTTTAGEVLEELMKLLNIPAEMRSGYGLFDVVGKVDKSMLVARSMAALNELPNEELRSGHAFVESCRRRVHVTETLLQLDSFWKPKLGLYRRFEIRPLSKDEQMSDELHRAVGSLHLVQSPSANRLVPQKQLRERESQTEFQMTLSNITSSLNKSHGIPLGPFLLLLRGFRTREDRLFYELGHENRVGRSETCEIRLHYPECAALLCLIHTEETGDHPQGGPEDVMPTTPYQMFLQCKSTDNLITINGDVITGKSVLQPGDVLAFDNRYLFLFKDTSQVQDRNLRLQYIEGVHSASSGVSTSSPKTAPRFPRSVQPAFQLMGNTAGLATSLTNELAILCDVVPEVLRLYQREELSWRLGGVYLVGLMEYGQHQLGHESADYLENSIMDYLSELIKKHNETKDGIAFQPLMRVAVLLFEVHFFYQSTLDTFNNNNNGNSETSTSTMFFFKNSEFFKRCTEQLMQTIFNGIIDNSKLISISRAVLLEDPFRRTPAGPSMHNGTSSSNGEFSSSNEEVSMETLFLLLNQIVNSFRSTSAPCVEHLSQHAMYLLFATITKCLVLYVLTEDSLLRWESGVRMRSNLDRLQEWLNEQSLREVDAATHLLSSVLDLLASPRNQLLKKTWVEIRSLYPLLPPSLLNQLLQHYEGNLGMQTRLWRHDQQDDAEVSYSASKAVEDYYASMSQPNDFFYEYSRPSIDLRTVINEKSFDVGVRKLMALIRNRTPRVDLREVLNKGMSYVLNTPVVQPPLPSLMSYHPQLISSSNPNSRRPSQPQEPSEIDEMASVSSAGASSRLYPRSVPDYTTHHYATSSRTNYPVQQSRTPAAHQGHLTSSSLLAPTPPRRNAGPKSYHPPSSQQHSQQPSKQLVELMRLSRSIQDLQARNLVRQNMLGSMNSLNTSQQDVSAIVPRPRSVNKPQLPVRATRHMDQPSEPQRKSLLSESPLVGKESIVTDQDFDLNMPDDLRLSISEEEGDDEIVLPASLLKKDTAHQESSGQTGLNREDDFLEEETRYVDVLLKKENDSLGLGLIDASTTSLGRPGLFIKTIRPDGPAFKSQLLNVGDEIVKVNNRNIVNMRHPEAMSLIKSTGRIVSLRVRKADPLTQMHIENST